MDRPRASGYIPAHVGQTPFHPDTRRTIRSTIFESYTNISSVKNTCRNLAFWQLGIAVSVLLSFINNLSGTVLYPPRAGAFISTTIPPQGELLIGQPPLPLGPPTSGPLACFHPVCPGSTSPLSLHAGCCVLGTSWSSILPQDNHHSHNVL